MSNKSSNRQVDSLTSARKVKRLQDRGQSVFEIACQLKQSVSWVKQRLLLSKLSPELYLLMAGVDSEQPGVRLSFSHALLLTSLPASHQLKMARVIVEKKLSLSTAHGQVLALKAKLQPGRQLYLRPAQQFKVLRTAIARCQNTLGHYLGLPGFQFDRLLQPQRRPARQRLLDELRSLVADLQTLVQCVENPV